MMRNHLKGLKLWQYITGPVNAAAKIDAKYEEYELDIQKINSWIANSVDPTIGKQLPKFKRPKEAWNYLSKLYTQSNSAK